MVITEKKSKFYQAGFEVGENGMTTSIPENMTDEHKNEFMSGYWSGMYSRYSNDI